MLTFAILFAMGAMLGFSAGYQWRRSQIDAMAKQLDRTYAKINKLWAALKEIAKVSHGDAEVAAIVKRALEK